jgi:WhiB family transcriptional regulator, redox-sensing transcriptional regulator
MSAPAQPLAAGDSLARHAAGAGSELDAATAAARTFLLRAVRPATHVSRSVSASSRGERDQDPRDLPCRQDPDLWFAEFPAELERAKTHCAACPIRLACLAVAIDRAEFAGVWGGHIFDRGRIVPLKRGRGRPPKRHDPPAASAAPSLPTREHNMSTKPTSTPERTTERRVHTAATRLYEAECALHAAHQSRVDAWIDAASQKLHDAVAEYLAAVAGCGRTGTR